MASEICQSFLRQLKSESEVSFYTKNIHFFLIPAVLFAFAWSFLEKRKSFKTNILGGRPALYRIINLLDGGVRDRWGTSFILGAMTTLVYSLTVRTLVSTDFPLWATVLLIYVQALEATFLTLPLFVCLSTRFRLLGGVIGLLYVLGWSVLSLYNFGVQVKCVVEMKSLLQQNDIVNMTWNDETDISVNVEVLQFLDVKAVLTVMIELPTQICLMCIVGKFISRIYDCIKTGEYTRQAKNELSAPKNDIYVKYLLDPVRIKATQRIRNKYLESFIYNIPGFTYSNPIFSTAFMMAILLYQVILVEQLAVDSWQRTLRILSKWFLVEEKFEESRISYILQGCGVASGIATGIYGCSVIYSLLMTYKRHMLMLYKGDREFLPKGADTQKPEAHIVRSTQYMGNQIIGMFYGIIICFICIFFPLSMLCIVFRLVELFDKVPQLLAQFQILVYPISVFIIFRLQIFIVGRFLLQERLNATDQQRPLAIDNRKAHDVFKFFMLFVNLSTGLIVFLRRLFSYILLGIFLVPRMDRCMFPKGFESGDKCHMNYVGMLIVDFTHNNPIMRVFCSVLLKTAVTVNDQRSNDHTIVQNATYGEIGSLAFPRRYQGNSRARTKWLVAYTLLKNPSIVGMRKNALPGIVLMEASNVQADIIDRVQRSIASTLFIHIGMTVGLLTIAFMYLGFKTILNIKKLF
ncbi:hypothetical protein ACJMK2_040910 [Sinanodonta woodiana]|uniref:Uncharacterized protein n=1 Tax=Sinanodonta woodiana TaxID=1069815 RepID=A0ABD3W5B0_SINWO